MNARTWNPPSLSSKTSRRFTDANPRVAKKTRPSIDQKTEASVPFRDAYPSANQPRSPKSTRNAAKNIRMIHKSLHDVDMISSKRIGKSRERKRSAPNAPKS